MLLPTPTGWIPTPVPLPRQNRVKKLTDRFAGQSGVLKVESYLSCKFIEVRAELEACLSSAYFWGEFHIA